MGPRAAVHFFVAQRRGLALPEAGGRWPIFAVEQTAAEAQGFSFKPLTTPEISRVERWSLKSTIFGFAVAILVGFPAAGVGSLHERYPPRPTGGSIPYPAPQTLNLELQKGPACFEPYTPDGGRTLTGLRQANRSSRHSASYRRGP